MKSAERLAIFIPSMSDGGAQRSMLKLACGIAKRNYSVDLVLAQMKGPFIKDIPDSIRIVNLNSPRVLASLPALIKYMRRERPIVMLSVLDYANIVAIWAKYLGRVSTRLIVSERNTLSIGVKNTSRWRNRFLPLLAKRFYPLADGIVTVSNGVADDLAKLTKLPRDRFETIYNPIITPELQKLTQEALVHPWFDSQEPPVIVAVGRLRPQKDFPTLIRAFAKVRSKRTARLIILGEGSERPELERLVKELQLENDVSLPGFVKNPYPYMVKASLFVLSSRWEGLPGVLIEALYCGVPVISTDCPSGPREILTNGKFGKLVPVQNTNILAEAIETALSGDLRRPPKASWQRFESEIVVDKYIGTLFGSMANA